MPTSLTRYVGTMVTIQGLATAVFVSGTLLLTSCTQPVASASATSTTATASTAAHSTSTAKVSTAPEAVHLRVPSAARTKNLAGARAFVDFYMEVVDSTNIIPDPTALGPLTLDSCRTCANYERQVVSLAKHHRHYSGSVGAWRSGAAVRVSTSVIIVTLEVTQTSVRLLTSTGKTVNRLTPKSGTLYFQVHWVGGRWRIAEIYEDW